MDLKNITIGSDPEFFASDGVELIPSYKFLPGTKESPFSIGGGYFVQRDNVLIEGNIPPAKTAEEFKSNMITLKSNIRVNFLNALNLQLVSADSGAFSSTHLNHPEAMALGCSPYDIAWNDIEPQNVTELKFLPQRPAGFHIHVGYEFASDDDKPFKEMTDIVIARLFDYFVIRPSHEIHLDEFRNKYYGGLGKIRHKSYGVELRSLGGFFTQDKYFTALFNQIEYIINLIKDDEIYFSVFQMSSIVQLDEMPNLVRLKETQKQVLINA